MMIYIYIENEIPEETTYYFKSSPGVGASLEKPNYPHSFGLIYNSKFLSYQNSGTITFSRVDYNEGIYAGTFSMTMKNKDDANDMIEITNGRFDIDLGTLNQD